YMPLGNGMFKDITTYERLAIDPRSPQTIYASLSPVCHETCTASGILRSDDGGVTWSPTGRRDSLTYALAIDPNDPAVVYASGADVPTTKGTAGLYRTLDGGVTWPAMFPGSTAIPFLTTDS